MHLAADIGGTKTLLGLFADARGARDPVVMRSFPTRGFDGLGAMVDLFLDGAAVSGATFGVAGAVTDRRACGSNLPWVVDAGELERQLDGATVRLVNDLEAIGTFVPALEPDDLLVLAEGVPASHGPIGVIAPGTGLGQAILVWVEGRYRTIASEAGHIDFAPNTPLQVDYLGYLAERFGHVSLERACSGNSFPLLFDFLTAAGFPGHPDIVDAMATADPTPVIVDAGLDGRCTASALALEMFVEMLGAAAGNLALQVVASGGIYLAGGIPPRIVGALRHPRFLEAFTHKGRFSALCSRMPIRVIRTPSVGLYGAALLGLSDRKDRRAGYRRA